MYSTSLTMAAACRTFFAALLWMPLICAAHDVVIERNVNLRVGPSTETEIIKLLNAGDQA